MRHIANDLQVELLELILIHLPIRTLSRALSVSKHCRDVITSNRQLRHTLFLESTPTSEYLITKGWTVETTTVSGIREQSQRRVLIVVQDRCQVSEDDRLIVKALPALHALPTSRYNPRAEDYQLPNCRTQHLFCDTIKKLPANTLLFQPPVTSVIMYHYGSKLWLECSEGAIFGVVARQLERQSTPFFYREKEQIAGDVDVDQVPSTQNIHEARAKAAREFYARRDQNCYSSLGAPCLYLEVEGAMGDNCVSVQNTRRKTMLLQSQSSCR